MEHGPYHIVISRKNQVLLSFLKIRVVVNGNMIYPLIKNQPLVISVKENHPKIVITDGFHHTKPLELVYHHLHTIISKLFVLLVMYS
ncbi:MAG: hypothetical protein JST17_08820 [Bacteroidetes bacterium]|nr:hypothetical protein [Bacteroidota bacterium]MBS1932163.1 hypothetical protein [Bacteroidota bacterium]